MKERSSEDLSSLQIYLKDMNGSHALGKAYKCMCFQLGTHNNKNCCLTSFTFSVLLLYIHFSTIPNIVSKLKGLVMTHKV